MKILPFTVCFLRENQRITGAEMAPSVISSRFSASRASLLFKQHTVGGSHALGSYKFSEIVFKISISLHHAIAYDKLKELFISRLLKLHLTQ